MEGAAVPESHRSARQRPAWAVRSRARAEGLHGQEANQLQENGADNPPKTAPENRARRAGGQQDRQGADPVTGPRGRDTRRTDESHWLAAPLSPWSVSYTHLTLPTIYY